MGGSIEMEKNKVEDAGGLGMFLLMLETYVQRFNLSS